MDLLLSIGGWGLLILLAVINGFIAWKVFKYKFWLAIIFVIAVVSAFILAVVTEPNCGCLSGYTYFSKATKWVADILEMAFWFIGNYFLMVMAAIALVYWLKGRHPIASELFWRFMFNLALSIIWAKLNFIYIKCAACPLICDLEMSWAILEECMFRNFF